MINQAEIILDPFPGNDFLLSCASMADHEHNSITCIILHSNLYRVHNFFLNIVQ